MARCWGPDKMFVSNPASLLPFQLVTNRDKAFKKILQMVILFSSFLKLLSYTHISQPPYNCRPLLKILLAFTMVKKKAMNCGMPLTLGERFWIGQLSRRQAKTHSPLRIRSFLWGRNRNWEKEFMELGRYNRRLKRRLQSRRREFKKRYCKREGRHHQLDQQATNS